MKTINVYLYMPQMEWIITVNIIETHNTTLKSSWQHVADTRIYSET